MKIKYIYAAVVAAIVLLVVCMFIGVNNRAVSLEEQINTAQSNIQVQEKRRVDLISNLVDCVKSYDSYEAKTLDKIVSDRNTMTDDQVKTVTNKLNIVAESYPELKASDNYQNLMNELSLTENGIADYRNAYNRDIRSYNKFVRKFPNKQILSMSGYERVEYNYLKFDVSDNAPSNLFSSGE